MLERLFSQRDIRLRFWVLMVLVAVVIAVATVGLLARQERHAAWDAQVVSRLQKAYPDREWERELADAYWSRNSGVMDDF